MTFGFPAHHTERYCAGTEKSADLRAAVRATLRALAWGIEEEAGDRIIASTSVNFRSWGERISLDFLPDNSISVTSKCALPTQCIDWGKNKDNIVKFMTEISKHVVGSSASRQMGEL